MFAIDSDTCYCLWFDPSIYYLNTIPTIFDLFNYLFGKDRLAKETLAYFKDVH